MAAVTGVLVNEGTSLTGATVILAVAVFEMNVPSVAKYVKESLVVSLPLCTYVKVPSRLSVRDPFAGGVTRKADRASPSGSLSL